jgi:DNA-directed RNA polymerase specialized sigma24 family protein
MTLPDIGRNRRRLWAICYRMTGGVHDADDLSQEAIARAIEREDQLGASALPRSVPRRRRDAAAAGSIQRASA